MFLAKIEDIVNCSLAMLAAKKSRDENHQLVKLEDLTDGTKFDGYEFEKFYSGAASKIYKD